MYESRLQKERRCWQNEQIFYSNCVISSCRSKYVYMWVTSWRWTNWLRRWYPCAWRYTVLHHLHHRIPVHDTERRNLLTKWFTPNSNAHTLFTHHRSLQVPWAELERNEFKCTRTHTLTLTPSAVAHWPAVHFMALWLLLLWSAIIIII